jgi:ABC-type phosphate/phosphonate transport system substrate-binding protein
MDAQGSDNVSSLGCFLSCLEKTDGHFRRSIWFMKVTPCFVVLVILMLAVSVMTSVQAFGEFRIVIMQDQKGAAEKYRPLLEFLKQKGIDASFVAARTYTHAADLFSSGLADGMFSGSGIAGCMMIKQLAYPVLRPVNIDGWSTYWAVVIGFEGSNRFTQDAAYFDNKKVIFSSLASAGEFYFRSLENSVNTTATLLKAASHGTALDALSRHAADFAIIKNRVWDKVSQNYPGLTRVGEDPGENPDGTLIVSEKMDKAVVESLRSALLALEGDSSDSALSVKQKLEIIGFIDTTIKDFKFTLRLLKKAGVDNAFNFRFE